MPPPAPVRPPHCFSGAFYPSSATPRRVISRGMEGLHPSSVDAPPPTAALLDLAPHPTGNGSPSLLQGLAVRDPPSLNMWDAPNGGGALSTLQGKVWKLNQVETVTQNSACWARLDGRLSQPPASEADVSRNCSLQSPRCVRGRHLTPTSGEQEASSRDPCLGFLLQRDLH